MSEKKELSKTVKVVCLENFVLGPSTKEGENNAEVAEIGEQFTLDRADYNRLEGIGRVAEATKENVARAKRTIEFREEQAAAIEARRSGIDPDLLGAAIAAGVEKALAAQAK